MELNQKYTFDSFVAGPANRFAYMASLAVAESPGKAYNPLYIYGGTGLGKTHLMHAIGNAIRATHSDLKIMYTSAEELTNAMMESMRRVESVSEFRDKCHTADVLLIDDVESISGKSGTQEELFHIINTLFNPQKQMVLASAASPRDIVAMEDKLRARFEWGLIAIIEPPELETRKKS